MQSLDQSVPFGAHRPNDGRDFSSTATRLLAEAQAALDCDLGTARACLRQLGGVLRAHALTLVDEAVVHVAPRDQNMPKGGLAPWQMRLISNHVINHLDQTIHVEALADLARLSTSHFCRAFKVSFGETPHAYVMSRRLEQARKLMLTTTENLCQIAAACGLADQAHLTRLFRRHFNETPYQWRRLWRENAERQSGVRLTVLAPWAEDRLAS